MTKIVRERTTHIIVHCSASRPSQFGDTKQAVDWIKSLHVEENGWRDIGYHHIIGRDGTVMAGRPESDIGAHAWGYNQCSIGICLVGGHGGEANDPFSKHYTQRQEAAFEVLIDELRERYPNISEENIMGHNRFAAKACPCFNVQQKLFGKRYIVKPPIQEARTKLRKSTTAQLSLGTMMTSIFGGIASILTSLQYLDTESTKLFIIGAFGVITFFGLWMFARRFAKWIGEMNNV